jgi:DNA-binding NtrC family response regulator
MNDELSNSTVVVVDDEEIVLTSLSALLAIETKYDVKTFKSPLEALEYIKKKQVDLVVSDYLMPEMDGLSFLSRVKQIQPEVPRIILTGYADKENAIKAINDVGLFQYIEKPWDNNDMLLIFRNALERNKLIRKLQEKMKEIDEVHAEFRDLQNEILKAFV